MVFKQDEVDHAMDDLPWVSASYADGGKESLTECTMDEALDRIGWGWRRVGAYIATTWTSLISGISASCFSVIGHRVDTIWGYDNVAGRFLGPTYFVASAFAYSTVGYAADRIGRRKMHLWAQVMLILGMSLTAVSQNIYMIFAGSFICGMGSPVLLWSQVIKAECASGKARDLELVVGITAWSPGVMISTALSVYAFPNNSQWWMYASVMAAILAMSLVLQFFLIPEPPRFYLARGKYEKATRGLVRLKQRFPSWIKKSSPEDKELGFILKPIPKVPRAPLKVLFTRRLFPRSVALWVCLFTLTGAYFSSLLSYPTNHAQLFYLAIIEIPANFFFLLLGRLIGRNWTLFIAFAAVTLLFSLAAGLSLGEWVQYPARFIVAGLLDFVRLFLSDIYSSAERGMASTIAVAIARPGPIFVPIIATYISARAFNITLAVLTVISGGLGTLFIPDMIGKDLIDQETTSTGQSNDQHELGKVNFLEEEPYPLPGRIES